jgi:hypothetical protein
MGGALRAGFTATTADVVTLVPGDGQFDLAQVLDSYPLPAGQQAVFMRRRERPEQHRNLISLIFHTMIRVLYRVDPTGYCGVYIVDGDWLRAQPLESSNVFLNAEVWLRYVRSGRPFGEALLDVRPRRAGSSKVANSRTMLRNAYEVVRFRFSR